MSDSFNDVKEDVSILVNLWIIFGHIFIKRRSNIIIVS